MLHTSFGHYTSDTHSILLKYYLSGPFFCSLGDYFTYPLLNHGSCAHHNSPEHSNSTPNEFYALHLVMIPQIPTSLPWAIFPQNDLFIFDENISTLYISTMHPNSYSMPEWRVIPTQITLSKPDLRRPPAVIHRGSTLKFQQFTVNYI
jgi:hypothetical protein